MKTKIWTIALVAITINTTQAQNQVQNSGFEAVTQWDSLWILSLTPPSTSTAVATEITTDSHTGERCAELSNTVFNKWSFFYSDSVEAPISLAAHKSYEVSGWLRSIEQGKSASLSFWWNGSSQEFLVYSGNPDPLTQPDWFLVKDTLTVTSDVTDGYITIGFRAGKDGLLPTGQLRLDDISVMKIPDIPVTDIIYFSIPGQIGVSQINNVAGTITAVVGEGTDLITIAPDTILLSRGAVIDPPAGDTIDFSNPVIYTVTAQDETTTREWIVTVEYPPSNATDIISFVLEEQTGPAAIDTSTHQVLIEVAYGTDVTSLVPHIEVSEGATVVPDSGIAADFSSPLIFTVTAEDLATVQEWTITVNVAAPSNKTDILSFVIPGQVGDAVIDTVGHTIAIQVPYATDLKTLTPSIEVSAGASIYPAAGTAIDFSEAVIFIVTAEDGTTVQQWVVTVNQLPNNATDIVSFILAEQTGPAVIDTDQHHIEIEVTKETAVTSLAPTIEVSPGATIDPASGIAVNFSSEVTYTVTAEDGTTVQDWSVLVTVDPAVSARAVSPGDRASVYPNPANTFLTIETEFTDHYSIEIISLNGKQIFSNKMEGTSHQLDLSSFQKGVYFITIRSKDFVTTRKIIKM